MNEERRQLGHITIALLIECNHSQSIGDEAHLAITNSLKHMQRQEFHQQRTQEKYAGQNASTDKQLAISYVALPALEEAVAAWENDDFQQVIESVTLAVVTDGTSIVRSSK